MKPIDIGSNRELFVDRYLVGTLENLEHVLHAPREIRENSLDNYGGYVTIIHDEAGYKRYYRSSYGNEEYDGHPGELTCVDISEDGISWESPDLDIYHPVEGRRNIILMDDPPRSHNFSPFLDENPTAVAAERYKALAGTHKEDNGRPDYVLPLPDIDSGLYVFTSPDGIHWKKRTDYPVITFSEFAFDSQNVSFWSEAEQCYVCYFRCWEKHAMRGNQSGEPERVTMQTHLRSVARTTSRDFIHWTEPVRLKPNFPGEHLYTTQAHPYFRAKHIYIALPTRFMQERGSSTDVMFMSARGAGPFDRTFGQAFVRPGNDPAAWGNRSNYANLNIYQTSPSEMSFYVRGIRRVLRIDGFASIQAKGSPGVLTTVPFTFTGDRLLMNYATSAAGSIRVTLLDAEDNREIPGASFADSREIIGDEIDGEIPVDRTILKQVSGKPVRMRVFMTDADLYSFRFSSHAVSQLMR